MKLALHRSLTFWSGILVIGFICWAWSDSYRHDTWRTARHFACSNAAGAVSLACYQVNFGPNAGRHPISPNAPPRPAFAAFSVIDSESKLTLPASDLNSGERHRLHLSSVPSGAYCFLNLPHWLLIAAAAPPWLALLLWRARRRKRASIKVA